jgi:hypothetical protein
MKHLKRFNENTSSYYDKLRDSGDLSEIMHIISNSDIIDEFPELSIDFFDSSYSTCLDYGVVHDQMTKTEAEYLKKNSITIEIYQDSDSWDKKALHYIEPKIWKIIEDINVMLSSIGYKIVYNDFGEADTSYELIITDKSY